jgi:hypothetical protein
MRHADAVQIGESVRTQRLTWWETPLQMGSAAEPVVFVCLVPLMIMHVCPRPGLSKASYLTSKGSCCNCSQKPATPSSEGRRATRRLRGWRCAEQSSAEQSSAEQCRNIGQGLLHLLTHTGGMRRVAASDLFIEPWLGKPGSIQVPCGWQMCMFRGCSALRLVLTYIRPPSSVLR